MHYRDLSIQTLREAPNNARTQGAAWLVRAGYLTREGAPLPLGQLALRRIASLDLGGLPVPLLTGPEETFFKTPAGALEVLSCPGCGVTARLALAESRKNALPPEEPLPAGKVSTPDCSTIEALAAFLQIPKEKTAKALMFTRPSDGRFVFAAVRGDMTLSEAKLKRLVGEVRLATEEEIRAAGAVPGYASPVGLREALIVVDDLIPLSSNLAAGANDPGWHLVNTNCGRDYTPSLVADLVTASEGAPCAFCGVPLELLHAESLAADGQMDPKAVLLALAETHRDDKGLCLPPRAAPLDVYLLHLPGKELDTRLAAEKVHAELEQAGLAVIFDDRDERAGVKFNDADLIGLPLRVTIGEKALREGMLELKPRTGGEVVRVPLEDITQAVRKASQSI